MNCGFESCGQPTRIRYPGNDPENGSARPYCANGHSTCECCGAWFQAITTTPEFLAKHDESDPGQVVPAGEHESSACSSCVAQFDDGYEGVDESTPPPGYCQEAWDYVRGMHEDPISRASGCADEFVEDFERKHYDKCETCARRIDLARMP